MTLKTRIYSAASAAPSLRQLCALAAVLPECEVAEIGTEKSNSI